MGGMLKFSTRKLSTLGKTKAGRLGSPLRADNNAAMLPIPSKGPCCKTCTFNRADFSQTGFHVMPRNHNTLSDKFSAQNQ